jgi:hypothetical protein
MLETQAPTPGEKLDAKLTPYRMRRAELLAQITRDRQELERIARRLADAECEQAQLDEQMLDAARELAGEDAFFSALLGGASAGPEAPRAAPPTDDRDEEVVIEQVRTFHVHDESSVTEASDEPAADASSPEERVVAELGQLLGTLNGVRSADAPRQAAAEAAAQRIRERLNRED